MPLDPALTNTAIGKLAADLGISEAETAAGILRITNAKIAGAVRVISIERGYLPEGLLDPRLRRSRCLCGGGGRPRARDPDGDHSSRPGDVLRVRDADGRRRDDFGQTAIMPLDAASIDAANEVFARLAQLGAEALAADGFPERDWRLLASAEMRYQGQEHTVNVPFATHELGAGDMATILEQFSAVHHQQYGHSMDDPVEIVTLRLRTIGVLPRQIPKIAAGDGSSEGAVIGTRSSTAPRRRDTSTTRSTTAASSGRRIRSRAPRSSRSRARPP